MTRILLLSALAGFSAFSQGVSCTATAPAPPILRVEGISERIADILLDCNSSLPAGTLGDLSVFVDGTILTNPLLSSNLTNALLLIDSPATNSQVLGQNVIQGGQQGTNSLVWRNLPIAGHHVFRITNVRVSGSIAGIDAKLRALVFVTQSGQAAPAFSSGPLEVATVAQGLIMTVGKANTFSQCTADTRKIEVRFAEQSPAAFKTAAQETGFYNARLGLPAAPRGTLLRATFDTMTNGTLSVSVAQASGTSTSAKAKYIGDGDVSDDGARVTMPVVDGKATGLWEVTATDPAAIEVLVFDLTLVTTTGGAAASSPTMSGYCVSGTFAPITASLPPVPNSPISRFADYNAALDTLGLKPSGSEIALPFVTNAAGFNTGINVATSTKDPFVLSATNTCSLTSYGSLTPGIYGNPQPYAEAAGCVPTGATFTMLASDAPTYLLDPAAAPSWKAGFSAILLAKDGVSNLTTLDASGASAIFSVQGASATGDWLSAEVWSQTTPATLRYRINPSRLAPGSYSRYVTVRTDLADQFSTIPINIVVTGNAPSFERAGVTHAGSYRSGYVAPGQATVIFGANFGTVAGDTHVYFDGIEAPKIYAYPGQVSVFAPFELTGKTSTVVQIEYQGVRSSQVTVSVLQQNPSLLTARSDGAGPVAAINQDNTVNSVSNPAPAGTIVTFFGTGAGQTIPASSNGQIGPANAQFIVPMTVDIGGQSAEILYQGPAPTLTAGTFQLNARIPAGTAPGPAMINIYQLGQRSQIGNIVWVK